MKACKFQWLCGAISLTLDQQQTALIAEHHWGTIIVESKIDFEQKTSKQTTTKLTWNRPFT